MGISELLTLYQKESKDTINLVASENVFGKKAKEAYQSDIMHRYSFDSTNSDFIFPGRDLIDQIETRTCDLIKHKLKAKYINIKAISGLNCMMMLLGVFTNPGDVVYSLPLSGGGHGATKPIADKLGLVHKFLPYDELKMDIDYEELDKEMKENSIKLIYLDFMNILFNIDLERLRDVIPKSTLIAYDASHVLGLIMGNAFQNPLEFGIDFILGSTHKTLPGPHKGIIATNRLLLFKKLQMFESLYVSHHHTGDVTALGIAVEELGDDFAGYSKQINQNVKTFSRRFQKDLPVVMFENRGFSETHQLWLDFDDDQKVFDVVNQLSTHKIIVNAMKLPTLDNRYGIRLGFQEVTFKGYKEAEITALAELMLDIILKNHKPEIINTKRKHLLGKISWEDKI